VRLGLVTFLIALTLGAYGCAGVERDLNNHSTGAQKGGESRQADGSTITVTTSPEGKKTETRAFASAEIASASRTTYPDQTQSGVVEFSDGRTVEINDPRDIGALMEASVENIKAAASKAQSATKERGEEVADRAGEASDKAVDMTKEGVEKAKKAAADAADAAGEGVKKAGREIKKAGERIKDKVHQ
jgi:hypothetical protein